MCKWIPIKHSEICGIDAIVSDLIDNVPLSQIISLKGCPLKEEVD